MSRSDPETENGIFSESYSYAGDLFRELEIPVGAGTVSRSFRCSGENPGIRIAAAALTTLVLKEGENIFFELLGSDSGKYPYDKRELIAVVSGPVRFSAGDKIMTFLPGAESKRFLKLKISGTGDPAPAVITAYLLRKRECCFS